MNSSTEFYEVISSVSLMTLQELTLNFGVEEITMRDTADAKKLEITFHINFLQVLRDEGKSLVKRESLGPVSNSGYLTPWRGGRLAIGGLLGEITSC